MRTIYCTDTQDRIPIEYFAQGKAIWHKGRPYLKHSADRLGLQPDPAPPAEFVAMVATSGLYVRPPAGARVVPREGPVVPPPPAPFPPPMPAAEEKEPEKAKEKDKEKDKGKEKDKEQ